MFDFRFKRGAPALPTGELVAYFCAEYGIGDQLPIYSGGLGVLAGDFLKEAAQQDLPMVAVGLFYKKGFFHQRINEEGQQEYIEPIDPRAVPLELLQDKHGETLLIPVPVHERTVFAQIWRYKVRNISLYLLDTDHWRNSEADRAITDQLYTATPERRLVQEMILGIGGYRALQQLDCTPSLYHLNEGHSAFLALELIHSLLDDDTAVLDALEIAKNRIRFTNHTLVAAGNDTYQQTQIRYYLGKYAFETGIGIDTLLTLGNLPGETGVFSMTHLALRVSGVSNAVSRLHAEKALHLWPDHTLTPITNGVHLPSWVSGPIQTLLDARIPTWKTEADQERIWEPVRDFHLADIWQAHQENKRALIGMVKDKNGVTLDENILTLVWARRFTAYKRPELLFKDIEQIKSLIFSSDRPIQIIVSGKSHPNDKEGKEAIEHLVSLAASQDLHSRLVFLSDYSISLAKVLVAGADLWVNTPVYGLEASGTSGMKAAANGALQLTTPDGWAHEVDWYGLGFIIPPEGDEHTVYDILRNDILPVYYQRDAHGIPQHWAAMMRESIASLSPRFSTTRMLYDYIDRLYRPD